MSNAALADETIRISAPVDVSVERIAYTLCAALEGGSTYWCEGFKPERYPEGIEWGHECVALCVPFDIVFEDGEKKHIENSKQHMEDTLHLFARKYPRHFGDMVGETEDALTGDILFQLLCFGEVVYG